VRILANMPNANKILFHFPFAGEEVDDGHADSYAVLDLVEDDGLFGVGDIGVEFYAAVDGAGVHDDDVFLEAVEHAAVDAVIEGVFAQGGEEGLVLALKLYAQDIGHVAGLEGFLDVVFHLYAEGLYVPGYECGRAGYGDVGAEFLEAKYIAKGNAGVHDIAKDGNVLALDTAELFADREGIEEGLRGVLISAIAGIDDAGIYVLCEEPWGTAGGMAHNDHIDLHGEDVVNGVYQCFAFGNGGARCGEVDHIGAEAFFGELEGEACAGRVLKKYIGNGGIAKGGDFLYLPLKDLLEVVGGFKYLLDIIECEFFYSEQMFY